MLARPVIRLTLLLLAATVLPGSSRPRRGASGALRRSGENMGNIREHGSDSPTEQGVRLRRIVDRVGEQGVSRLADLSHEGRMQAAVIGMDCRTAEPLGQPAPIPRHRMKQYASGDFRGAGSRRHESLWLSLIHISEPTRPY